MKTLFLILVLSFSVFGQQVDISSLPESERLAIQQKLQQQPITNKVSEWTEIGKAVGVAVKETASVLNVEVNNFAQTPVGKLTIFLIIWKLMSTPILGLAICSIVFFICISSIKRIWYSKYKYQYETYPILFGFWTKKKVLSVETVSRLSDGEITMCIVCVVAAMLSVIVALVSFV